MVSFRQFVMISIVCFSFPLAAEIAVEPAESLKLPNSYPSSWIFAHSGDEVVILDVAAASHNYKGVLQAAHFANFVESKRRNELYVAETVYSRGTHGIRTDLITIYDKVNISPIGEIILPDNKRGLLLSQKGSFQLTQDDRFALVFNFTPAASVLVVDVDKRQIVNEVPMPGCYMIYPSGERGFSTLCSNGALASFQLDEKGQLTGEHVSKSFNDIDIDPLFMKSTTIKGITYFPSFKGRLQPIDMRSDKAKVLKAWSLLDEQDQTESWRPSGHQLITADNMGRLYILMRKNAIDGNHELGGEEVWVFDMAAKKRIARISLKKPGRSIEVTQGEQPYLSVTNKDGAVDVYYGRSGHFIRSIAFGGYPTVLHAAK
ncbi:hypothetical protein OAE19_08050 [Porticoccaceae bacterium]|nr:hypothetical protein [Porticoccaceae bacterium]